MDAADLSDAVPFAELGLPDPLVDALARHGIVTAFPIQAATIADALAGRDVLGKARTGSGKTLGFGLPAIVRLADGPRPEKRRPKAIVLVPTRELGMQVSDALEPYAHAMHVSLKLVAGGLSMSKQIQALERGVHLVVATPGRMADLVRNGHADLSELELIVMDEADHMADMGFMDEITEILAGVPEGGQRLLFSATLDGDVDRLVKQYMHDPVTHDVTDGDDQPATMRHVVLNVPPHAKYQLATRIAAREGRTIVFVRTKLATERIADEMREAGVLALAIHGDRSQAERNFAIASFRAGDVPVLVATDVAARGIHVDHVDLVMQIDPPADHKDYLHRSGRTARAGEEGLVVTLVLPHQRRSTDRMLEQAGVDVTFRKVRGEDDESLAMITELTGAQEPSWQPVREPRPQRPERRGKYDRPGRADRPARGDRPRQERRWEDRPARTWDDRPRRDDRPQRDARDSRGDDLRATQQRMEDRLARIERDLADREAALAARERGLSEREARLDERGPRRYDDRQGGSRGKGRDDKPGKKGYGKKPAKGGYDSATRKPRKPRSGR
ncbi:DEAD/DEAH box helicase [Demequina phytophila]|uniref:DEAD/DEAH box helicase n=1 Tax=Demequina phytophila TaxID=1638981 RepID=UPI0007834F54|nr:DEAD/DEAH box helicase [Demequina phytophila]